MDYGTVLHYHQTWPKELQTLDRHTIFRMAEDLQTNRRSIASLLEGRPAIVQSLLDFDVTAGIDSKLSQLNEKYEQISTALRRLQESIRDANSLSEESAGRRVQLWNEQLSAAKELEGYLSNGTAQSSSSLSEMIEQLCNGNVDALALYPPVDLQTARDAYATWLAIAKEVSEPRDEIRQAHDSFYATLDRIGQLKQDLRVQRTFGSKEFDMSANEFERAIENDNTWLDSIFRRLRESYPASELMGYGRQLWDAGQEASKAADRARDIAKSYVKEGLALEQTLQQTFEFAGGRLQISGHLHPDGKSTVVEEIAKLKDEVDDAEEAYEISETRMKRGRTTIEEHQKAFNAQKAARSALQRLIAQVAKEAAIFLPELQSIPEVEEYANTDGLQMIGQLADYEINEVITDGSHIVHVSTASGVVLKEFNATSDRDVRHLKREVRFLHRLSHPFIASVEGYFEDDGKVSIKLY